jgi:DNA-binding transcriptional MocR family regulator
MAVSLVTGATPAGRKWHKCSQFGDGPRVPLDREQRAQFKARLSLQRRPGRITLAAEKIGMILCNKMGADGALFPAHETLAVEAGVHKSTVQRSLERLRQFGFVEWVRRLIRTKATGWRCEQATNAYVLRVPACEVHFARQVPLIRIKKEAWEQEAAVSAPTMDRGEALAALRSAAVGQAERLAASWAGRRR